MKEYDLCVPRNYNDGSPVARAKLLRIKQLLVDEFGGVTEIPLRKKGWWKLGNVTFRDRITIFRTLAKNRRHARHFFRRLKEALKVELDQEEILVVERDVTIL